VIKRKYNEKCDVWSCGVILYLLLCGYPPFYGKTEGEIMQQVELGIFDFPEKDWNPISREARDLISKCLEFNPETRCSAEQALNDEWILKYAPKMNLGKNIATDIWKNLKEFKVRHR
jgi:calcium-dependent protein kinase